MTSLRQADKPQKSIVVVGGGLAGTAAALALARQGVSVRLLESRRRLGGRTGSFSPATAVGIQLEEEAVDYCQHVGMGCCTNLRQLIQWLGQQDAWREYRDLHFYSSTGRYQHLRALPWLPAPLHLLGWLVAWPNLSWRDRLLIARGMLAIRQLSRDDALEALPALTWLQGLHQTPRAVENFWSTIVVSALGEELANVSAAAVCQVLQDGFLNHRQAFHVLVPQRPLDTLFNIEARQRLEQLGVVVQFGAEVQQLRRAAGHVQIETRESKFAADGVVLAVPWHRLSKLAAASDVDGLSPVAERAQRLASSPITGIHTLWDRPWLEHPHAAIVGRLCQWVFAAPQDALINEPPAERGSFYYQIVISASRQLPAGDRQATAALIRNDLAAIFPKSRDANLLRFKVVTDPQAVFSVAPKSLEYRATTRAVGSDIVLAGDWTRSGWPATMEGAILSGFIAAESLLSSWGRNCSIAALPLATNPQRKTSRRNRSFEEH